MSQVAKTRNFSVMISYQSIQRDCERATLHYLNFQRVDFSAKCSSQKPNTTRGRTANTGSFIERMSSFIPFMLNLYLRSYVGRNLRRAATSVISAVPSTITASFACSVQTIQFWF